MMYVRGGVVPPISVDGVFPGAGVRVFANWFTGDLRLPEGEMLEYSHAGYASVFEREVVIEVREGCVVSERVVEPPPEWVAEIRKRNAAWALQAEEDEKVQEEVDRMRAMLIDKLPRQWPLECSIRCDAFVAIMGSKDLAEFFDDQFEVHEQIEPLLCSDETDLWPVAREWAENHRDYFVDVAADADAHLISFLERFTVDEDDGDDDGVSYISGLGENCDLEAAVGCLANYLYAVLCACRKILLASKDS